MTELLLVFATIQEAKPFIEITDAKSNRKRPFIHTATDENTSILITGIGVFNASIRLTEYLSTQPLPSLVVNIGMAGSFGLIQDQWYKASAISYYDSKTHYTDIICREEKYAHLHTVNTPADKVKMAENPNWMYDMEAYGLFASARYFLNHHQFQIFKYISDRDGSLVSIKNSLSGYTDSCPMVWSKVKLLFQKIISFKNDESTIQSFRDKFEVFCTKNRLSFSQKNLLMERLTYLKNLGFKEVVDTLLQKSYLEFTDRDRRFAEIINELNKYE